MEFLKWRNGKRKKVLDGSIFDVYTVDRSSTDGRDGTFMQIQAPDWVTVLPIVKDSLGHDAFVMVRQYRHGSEEVTLEFPAGTVEAGEPPHDAALRELIEETGARPASLVKLGEVSPNPAFMDNRMTFYLAEGLEFVQPQRLDEHEMIEVELVRINDVIHSMGTGPYDNGMMVAALLYFLRWKKLLCDAE